ncbi:hypothetical protein BC831DRAFT_12143 [Entophlyctis helioformis]|nr:hypothetical protein BC831DRAFT_12143 [Entophlyctis helioformis]
MPPGTANRINQARPGTAARINVIDRPTTQQGLGGIRIKNQGPGRMVQDVTFFQNELRQKVNILAEEIYRINTEIDTVTKENSNYATFEKRADTLAEELKELQGQLGDLNTLVDKLHTDTDLDELERQYNQLKAKNQRESQVLDEIFMQRQQREATIRDIEKQIGEERQKAEEQINELDPARRAEYLRLKDENDKHLAAISRFQDEMEQMAQKSQAMQLELSQDLIKQKAVSLHERLNEVREKKRELEEAIKKAENESGPQEKARLLDQVGDSNLRNHVNGSVQKKRLMVDVVRACRSRKTTSRRQEWSARSPSSKTRSARSRSRFLRPMPSLILHKTSATPSTRSFSNATATCRHSWTALTRSATSV